MDNPVGLILMILFAVLGAPLSRHLRGRAWSAWQEAASELGLSLRRGGFLRGDAIVGRLGGVDVLVDSFRRHHGKHSSTYTRMRASGMGRIPGDLSLGTEGFFSSIEKALGGQDIQTHDAAFDQRIRIRGQEAAVVALLDGKARRVVDREVGGNGVVVRDGEAYWETRGLLRDRHEITSRLRGMVDLVNHLTPGQGTVVERLARNATGDVDARVRLRNLQLLQRLAPRGTETLGACRALLASDDPNLRLAAAMHLGDEGLPAVEALADAPHTDGALLAGALQHLIAHAAPARTGAILEKALGSPHDAVRRVAIAGVAKLGHRGALARLVALGDAGDAATTAAVAAALAQLGDAGAEAALVRWLASESEAVCIAAARALGEIGTVAAVEPLLPRTKGILADGDIKRAAREAIERIQSRLGDVEAGRLSLSETAQREGALSLSSGDEEGKLSLAPEEAAAGEAASGTTAPAPPASTGPDAAARS